MLIMITATRSDLKVPIRKCVNKVGEVTDAGAITVVLITSSLNTSADNLIPCDWKWNAQIV